MKKLMISALLMIGLTGCVVEPVGPPGVVVTGGYYGGYYYGHPCYHCGYYHHY